MKPSQLAQSLKRIAAGIEASKKPNKQLVIRDLKNILAAVDSNEIAGITLYWLEPEEDNATMYVKANLDTIRQLAKFLKSQAGDEYGSTIPSIRPFTPKSNVLPGGISNLEDLASAIRYDTGEEIYSEDFPLFADAGIKRS